MTDIARRDWIKRWAGSYTFISADYWGRQYYTTLTKDLGIGFSHSLFVHTKGTVAFYLLQNEFETFGKAMAQVATSDAELTEARLKGLKENADKITEVMNALSGKIPSQEEYEDFLVYFERHLPLHNFMKKTVDFLKTEELERLLPSFKDARLYSEHVYSDTERFFRSVTQAIAEKHGYAVENTTCFTQDEFETYIKDQSLPSEQELAARYENSALFFEEGKRTLVLAEDVAQLEKEMVEHQSSATTELKGVSAFAGTVTGTVRIVLDPLKDVPFEQGDILVTGMTRPEFMRYMQKAGAIVTDAGGILCHAAISARELKLPCVVGTQVASKVLKDGDMVEVDAEKGVVRKI